MIPNRRGKKNKNAVVQNTENKSEFGASSNTERNFKERGATSQGPQSRGMQGTSDWQFGKPTWSSKLAESSARANLTSDTSLDAVVDEFNDVATGMHSSKRETTNVPRVSQMSKTQKEFENYPWPGNADVRAENEKFWHDYNNVSSKRDTHHNSSDYSKSGQWLPEVKDDTLKKYEALAQKKTHFLIDNRHSAIFKDNVDEPLSVNYDQSTKHWNQFSKGNTSSASLPKVGGDQGNNPSFNDMQESFVQDSKNPNIADGSLNDDKDEVLEHPDWQFLDEFSESTSKGMNPPVKPKRNKNVTETNLNYKGSADTAKDLPGQTSNISSNSGKATGYRTKYQETSKTLADLVLHEGLIVKDVYPDGNCLFAAIVDQLHVRGEFYFSTRSLRDAAVMYLTDHPCQEDGTHLKHFLTEHDGTWEQYLARMSHDGEWGDHFVISALANVLKRKLVVLRGLTRLTRTVMEPSKPNKTPDSQCPEDQHTGVVAGEGSSQAISAMGQDEGENNVDMDALYLGHIAEAHYVSLRHYNWREQFCDRLKRHSLPSFLHYGPDCDRESTIPISDDSLKEEHVAHQPFPETHLNMLLKFIQKAELFWLLPLPDSSTSLRKLGTVIALGDVCCGLEASIRWSKTALTSKMQDNMGMFYCIMPHDTVVVGSDIDRRNVSKKDLVAKESFCPAGFTLLTPVTESLWVRATVQMNDEMYVKHLFYDNDIGASKKLVFAFKCIWPKCAEEFLSRQRPHNWPSQTKLQAIEEHGVQTVSEASYKSKFPEVEWMFSFQDAEKVLCRGMKQCMKYVFYLLRTVHEFLLEDKDELSQKHLKAVFFYSCEELPHKFFIEQPWYCLQYMLIKLQIHLKKRFLPDYFVKGKNLIMHVDEHILIWYLERLEWFLKYIVEGLFLMLDSYNVMEFFNLRKCFETLITDAQKFVKHQNFSVSYKECFLPLGILTVQNMMKERKFDKANEMCDSIFQECTGYCESFDGPDILKKVLYGQPLQEQWLFAFYMDIMKGSNLIEHVCADRECVPLSTYFGDRFIQALEPFAVGPIHSINLRVPVIIAYSESLVTFANNFTEILSHCTGNDTQAFKTAAHFFLKNFTKDLLQNIAQEEINGDYHTGHANTKSALYKLFCSLYDRYDWDREWLKFKDLMEVYDMLSRHYNYLDLNEHVLTMWKYFRNTEKYNEALARCQSLQY